MTELTQAPIHRLKYVSVGTVLGPVNRRNLIIKSSIGISGVVNRYKTATERHSGVAFRVYHGRFFGKKIGGAEIFKAIKCVLPPLADQLIYDTYSASDLITLFSIQINIIPCPKHSSGFDWAVDVLPTPRENEIFGALSL